MSYPEIERLSPNREIGGQEALGVLFHHSEETFEATIALMTKPESRVSYHCLIDLDGTRCTLVKDGDIAWHAGVSSFLGRTGCNAFLLGLSFAGDTRKMPLSSDQIASALEWLSLRWTFRGWDVSRMVDHRQVAPGRKFDLDPVQWAVLSQAIAQRFEAKSTP